MPSDCLSSPLMTPIPYHTMRNLVNYLTQYFYDWPHQTQQEPP